MLSDAEVARAWDALLAVAAGDEDRAEVGGLIRDACKGWRWRGDRERVGVELVDLYLPFIQPLAAPEHSRVIGHLGQSLDGFIATHTGDSCFVTGQDNIKHLHRMRALADAVVVGAGTAINDDPQLTTRLVPGPSPVRIVLDPSGRLSPKLKVMVDGKAPTLICRAAEAADHGACGNAEVVTVPLSSDGAHELDLGALCAILRERGLKRLFVEGGGLTVSRFLQQRRLSRLQIAVAPVIIGQGRRGITLPPIARLSDALRPAHRLYYMGQDVLFDFDFATGGNGPVGQRHDGGAPRLIV